MNFWKFLELDPTNDRDAVKRAYAKLLRKYHPEDDAEGFQKLRKAYDMAIEQIAFQEWREAGRKESDSREVSIEADGTDSPALITATFYQTADLLDDPLEYRRDARTDALNELVEKAEDILSSRDKYDEKESWERLFADPSLWNLETKMEFSNRLFLLLYEKKCTALEPFTMPFDVWRTIDSHFHWREREIQLYRMVDESMAHLVMDPIWRAYHDSTVPKSSLKAFVKDIRNPYKPQTSDFSWWFVIPLIILLGRMGGSISQCAPDYFKQDSSIYTRDSSTFTRDSLEVEQMPLPAVYDLGLESEEKGNYSKAAECYTKAANDGHVAAQYRLGTLYEQGKGIIKSYPEAFRWYGTAARYGNPDAQLNLGLMYESGRGVSRDYVAAYMWLSLSIRYNATQSNMAATHLSLVKGKMTDPQIDFAESLVSAWRPSVKLPRSSQSTY